MKKAIWDLLKGQKMSVKARKRLFLAAVTLLYALIGCLLWLLIGNRLFPGRKDWMLCFIGFPAFFPGFLLGILYIYNHE
ncbi:MAG: hypothetical protein II161_02815 [Erysipelotrichaceae bacterium]|nr:hypothetical protein [Erysipelotrichaceae bacterium]MBQ4251515.1 hypothetical protein [Erysipelotrichaceae bacterium]